MSDGWMCGMAGAGSTGSDGACDRVVLGGNDHRHRRRHPRFGGVRNTASGSCQLSAPVQKTRRPARRALCAEMDEDKYCRCVTLLPQDCRALWLG